MLYIALESGDMSRSLPIFNSFVEQNYRRGCFEIPSDYIRVRMCVKWVNACEHTPDVCHIMTFKTANHCSKDTLAAGQSSFQLSRLVGSE